MAPNEKPAGDKPKSLLFRLLLLTETCLKLRGTPDADETAERGSFGFTRHSERRRNTNPHWPSAIPSTRYPGRPLARLSLEHGGDEYRHAHASGKDGGTSHPSAPAAVALALSLRAVARGQYSQPSRRLDALAQRAGHGGRATPAPSTSQTRPKPAVFDW